MPADDPLHNLGVRCTPDGGTIRVWSGHATGMDLVLFDPRDPEWVTDRVPLAPTAEGVWTGTCHRLIPGTPYALTVTGPGGPPHAFDPRIPLRDPYGRGLVATADGPRSVALADPIHDGITVANAPRPNIPLDHTVVYEAHVRGFSKLNPRIPEPLRGSYAGLAHDASIEYLRDLGITAVELLPINAFVSEQRLIRQGRVNYWGYNTLNFFTPHAPYASDAAAAQGAAAVRREFAGMVQRLHEAGIEVILDVVFNHTAEEGPGGPTSSLRGIDNASYYRVDAAGYYYDTTGCGNTVNYGTDAAVRLVLDAMRYWVRDLGVDGFRFDLAVALGRDAATNYTPDHPLLQGMLRDPILRDTKLIAEPWDIGPNGWRTGGFPAGFTEWNDQFRDLQRDFWLSDLQRERLHGSPGNGIGLFATRLAGSSDLFATERGPLASLNFITAHDGFTLTDLVSYDEKHNLGNGENNRDGTNNNLSYNHGVEGSTDDAVVQALRGRSIRNLLGSLLLSAGVPMLVAGDECGRSQRGNNNAYCQDTELTWLDWTPNPTREQLLATTRKLIRLRRENPALRPVRYGKFGETVPSASQMDWYDTDANTMTADDWNSPSARTLQYLAASTPEWEGLNRILLIVHARDSATEVTLAHHEGVRAYRALWDSAVATPDIEPVELPPGTRVPVAPYSMRLYYAVP